MKPIAVLILFLYCLTFVCCGREPQPTALDSYRIQIGEKEFTFKQQMLFVTLSLELYRIHVGSYPNSKNNLEALLATPEVLEATGTWRGPYIYSNNVFTDPWGRRLSYTLKADGKIDFRSLGEDGVSSVDDIVAKDLFPDIYRESEHIPMNTPIPQSN